jgi:hypothetical protein
MDGMLHVQVSEATVRRHTEYAGSVYETIQTEEVERIEKKHPAETEEVERLVFSVDGAIVPLQHGEWGEARTLVVAEAGKAVQKGDDWQVSTQKRTYFSRMVNSETFQRLALVEMYHRSMTNARQVAVVADGAEWIQSFIDYHRPDALRILDFAHVAERLNQVGTTWWGDGTPQAQKWLAEQLHELKHRGPPVVWAAVQWLANQRPENEMLRTNLNYLEKRQDQMHYPQYQQQGWPIGSGMVESANKLVVEARLKGSGMHWERSHVNPMLALRNIVCSQRWQKAWPLIESRIRLLRTDCGKKHRITNVVQHQLPTRLFKMWHKAKRIPSRLPAKTVSSSSLASVPYKPPANHPWRHSPIGRARYKPSHFSKT